jgi:hypothetical protein
MRTPLSTHLAAVTLGDRHQATGNTRHFVGRSLMARPATLRISRYGDEPGYSLLYLDDSGGEQTDTWHQTLEGAM